MTTSKKQTLLLVLCAIVLIVAAVLMFNQTAYADAAEPSGYYWKINGNVIADNTLTVKRGSTYRNITFWHDGQQVTDGTMTPSIQSQNYVSATSSSVSTISSTPLTYDSASSQVVEWVFSDGTKISGAELKLKVVPSTQAMLSTNNAYGYEYNIYNVDRLSNETVTVTVRVTNYKGGTLNMSHKLTASSLYNITFIPTDYFISGTLKLQIVEMQYAFNGITITYTVEQDPDVLTGTTLNLIGYFASGIGTTSEPYQISNERELRNIEKVKTNIGSQAYITSRFKLTSDINLASAWTPIPYELIGIFDGNGKTIDKLKINVSSSGGYFGLFEKIDTGTIQNVTFTNVDISCSSTSSSSFAYVGVVAGLNKGTISNCNVYGTINVQMYNADVGGIVGSNRGKISNCINYAEIKGSGNIGGIAGLTMYSNSVISQCHNYGTISYYYKTQNGTAGGIVGKSQSSASITGSSNHGLIKYASTANSDTNIAPCMGQIIGWNLSGLAPTNCAILSSGGTNYTNLLKYGTVNQRKYCSDYDVGLTGAK